MKQLKVLLPPLDKMLDHCRVTLSGFLTDIGTHLNTWVERDSTEKSVLSKEITNQ